MSKDIRETFDERIVNNFFVFSLVDVHIEKMIFEMLPFKVYCHCFYCRRGSRLFGRCDICRRFFVDDQDIAKKLDGKFAIIKKGIKLYPVGELMELVNAKAIVLNINYLVGEYQSKTENFGEVCFEIANNSFGVFIFYVQIYLRMFFDLPKPVTEIVIDNYLAEHRYSSQNVSKAKKKIKKDLFSCLKQPPSY